MTWREEVSAMRIESRGNWTVFAVLLALRKTENGGPGLEFGVKSAVAPNYAQQLHLAANSIRNAITRAEAEGLAVRTPDGYLTDEVLAAFSHRYAPVVGATDDPHALNANHLPNLRAFHAHVIAQLTPALDGIVL